MIVTIIIIIIPPDKITYIIYEIVNVSIKIERVIRKLG